MRKIKHLAPALEAIDFQNGQFHKELTLALVPFIGVPSSRQDIAGLETKLEKIITKHTGAEIQLQIVTGYAPCTMIKEVDVNSIFSNYWGTEFYAGHANHLRELAKARKQKGSVDLANSRVTGVFAKGFSTIYFDPSYLRNGQFTGAEMSAIILHEVGHFFGMVEMIDRTAGTNQVLASVDRLLKNATDVKERELVLQYGGEALGLDDRVIQQVVDTKSDAVATTLLVVAVSNQESRTDQKNQFYELNTPEYTSDEFAARHGATRDLITALDKIFIEGGVVQKRSTWVYLCVEALKIIAIIAGVATFLPTSGLLFVIAFLWAAGDSSDAGVPTYDNPMNRLTRARAVLIEQAKKPLLPKAVAVKLLEDVKVIDGIIKTYTDRRDFFTFIFNNIGKMFGATGISDTKYQRDLEQLINNDLFLRALELRHH